jgi:hypothetical protein
MELLNELISETKSALDGLITEIEKVQVVVESNEKAKAEVQNEYNRILTWADMYEGSSTEARKMILRQLIKKAYIGQHYKLKLDLAISIGQFQQLCPDQEQVNKPA